MRNAQNIRMHFCATTCASSLPRSRSEWASINRTCVLLCITICRKIWRAITRRPDAPDATDYPANAYCSSARAMLPSSCISSTKKPRRRRVSPVHSFSRWSITPRRANAAVRRFSSISGKHIQPGVTTSAVRHRRYRFRVRVATTVCSRARHSTEHVHAQKFLSCVYRIHARHGFGFGLGHVVDVLRGADTEAIRQRGHNELSTYGIGGELKRAEWQAIGRELLRLGLVECAPGKFATLSLTPAGLEALRKRTSIVLTKQIEIAEKSARIKPGAIECDEVLFERLRALRRQLADERGVPAYIIFSDVSLREMARNYPTNSTEFRRIPGRRRTETEGFWRSVHERDQEPFGGKSPAISSERCRFYVPKPGGLA